MALGPARAVLAVKETAPFTERSEPTVRLVRRTCVDTWEWTFRAEQMWWFISRDGTLTEYWYCW